MSKTSHCSISFNSLVLTSHHLSIHLVCCLNKSGWKLTGQREVVWFWFHSAVQHESWVLVTFLFGLVKEVRRCTKKKERNGSITSYIPNLLGKRKNENAEAKVQDSDIYNHTDIIYRGACRMYFSIANWHVITLRLFGKEEINPLLIPICLPLPIFIYFLLN